MSYNIVTLKDVTKKISSGATPKGGKESYYSEGISLIRSQNVLDFSFSLNGLAFIDEEQASSLKNVVIESQDVLLNITGDSVARCCMCPDNVLPARVNQHVMLIRAEKEKIDPKYLMYSLLEPLKKRELLSLASHGGTRNALTKKMIEDLEISLPDLDVQKRIVSILNSLDKKNELNNRMNKNLEQMAQAIFKQWFVDFEFPNEQGEPYKSSGGKMVWCEELGKEIPDDWKVGTLGDIGVNKTESITSDNIPENSNYLGLEHIPRKKLSLDECGDSSSISSNKYSFNIGDVLFGKLRPYFHKVILAPIEGVCSTDILVINSKSEELYGLLVMYLFDENLISYVSQSATGTKMPRTNWKDISQYNILIPHKSVYSRYNSIFKEISKKFEIVYYQNNRLKNMRDTLLPKLMSGEIDVSNIQL